MSTLTETDLFLRGATTLVASWEEHARGAAGATVERAPGADIAVFPHEPERAVYNNALLVVDLSAGRRANAIVPSKQPTPLSAWSTSPPGCTRATRRCAEISRAVATRSTAQRARWQ